MREPFMFRDLCVRVWAGGQEDSAATDSGAAPDTTTPSVRSCMCRFLFSLHAFQRVVERNISEAEIREAGLHATMIEDYPDDK